MKVIHINSRLRQWSEAQVLIWLNRGVIICQIKINGCPRGFADILYRFNRDRRNKKRTFRSLWIQRINAAARLEGMSYSVLMGKLAKAGIEINRKVLADLAMNNPAAFKAIVDKVK